MLFGDILRELLEEEGLSQKQLANDLNISAPTLGNYVRNLRQPDFETVKRIAAYFSVTTDYLLDYRSVTSATREEEDLIRIFRSMDAEQQKIYLEQGKAFARRNFTKKILDENF